MLGLCKKPSGSLAESTISIFGQKKVINRKLLVLGDKSTGKSSLLHVYALGYFPEIYEPTVFEKHMVEVLVGDQLVEMCLWDDPDTKQCDKSRPGQLSNAHLIMLCFSVDQPESLSSVENKWLDTIIENFPGVKICLVALKCDLRDNPGVIKRLARRGKTPVDYEQGLTTARRIRASRYLECSARQNRGVSEAFLEVAKVSINSRATSIPIRSKNEYQDTAKEQKSSTRSCVIF